MVFGAIAGAATATAVDATNEASGGLLNRIFQILLIVLMLGALALVVYIILIVTGSDLVSFGEDFSFWRLVGLEGFIDEASSQTATAFTILTAGFATLWGRK